MVEPVRAAAVRKTRTAAPKPAAPPVATLASVFIQTPEVAEPLDAMVELEPKVSFERTRRATGRRQTDELPLGQRWKRRLPKACR